MRTLLFFFLFFASAAGARAAPLPEQLRGSWAHPDCAHYDEALIITRAFYLKSTDEKTVFHPISVMEKRGDYGVLDIGGVQRPVMRSEDSLLKIGDMDGSAASGWAQNWDDLHLFGRNEYAGCFETPTLIPVPLVHAMSRLDEIKEACGTEMGPACKTLLFSIADTNKNKRISPAEFKKLGAMVETFIPLIDGKAVSTADLEAAYKQGIADGQSVAEQLIAAHDANRSGDLSLDEMKGADTVEMRKAAEMMGKLFAGFGTLYSVTSPASP